MAFETFKQGSSSKYDVQLDHLDYGYVSKCKDAREVEKILKVLRSGAEGKYPDLERHTENRLEELNPESKSLRKSEKLATVADLGKDEWCNLQNDLDNWSVDMKSSDQGLRSGPEGDGHLPPVRGSGISIPMEQNDKPESQKQQTKSNKRVKPRDYREWDKVDVDAELDKIDQEEKKPAAPVQNVLRKGATPRIPNTVDITEMTEVEMVSAAEREKDKGNEAFRSRDYEEALLYYTRSLSVIPTIAARNNRGQSYLKLEKWNEAVDDCNKVLEEDPNNLKAYLRRGVGYQGKRQYIDAKKDLQKVLMQEPNNRRAQEVLKEVDRALAEQKVKGRRMVIEESDGSDSEDSDTDDQKTAQPPLVNGVNGTHEPSAQNGDSEEDMSSKEPGAAKNSHLEKGTDSKIDNVTEKLEVLSVSDTTSGQPDQVSEAIETKNETICDKDVVQDNTDRSTSNTQSSKEEVKQSESKSVIDESDGNTSSGTGNETQSEVKAEETVPPPVEQYTPPIVVNALKDQGNNLFKKGQYGEAVEKYKTAIDRLLPDKEHYVADLSVLYSNRAASRLKIGECQGCVEDCTRALELVPGSVKALVRRAQAYEAKEKYKEAYVDYKQALLVDHRLDNAQQGSTRCQKILQQEHGHRWREKLPSMSPVPSGRFSPILPSPTTPAPETTPMTAPAPPAKPAEPLPSEDELFEKAKTLGSEFVKKSDFHKAIDCYNKCVGLFPDRAVSYTNRALCHLRLNQPGKVVADCNEALKLEDNNVKALFRRAQAYKMMHQYHEAGTDLANLLKVDPNNKSAKTEFQLVLKYRKEQEDKKKKSEEKPRQRIKIQEVDSSSDEEVKEETTPKVKQPKAEVSSSSKASKAQPSPASTPAAPPKQAPTTATPASQDTQTTNKPLSKSAKKRQRQKQKQAETKEESAVPTLGKGTPYEFMSAWNALKQSQGTAAYAKLLEQIEPQQLPKLISNKLDGQMLTSLIRCADYFIDKGEADRACGYLEHLQKVPRFSTISMFMSSTDKQELKKGVGKLKEKDTLTSDGAETLSKAYSI